MFSVLEAGLAGWMRGQRSSQRIPAGISQVVGGGREKEIPDGRSGRLGLILG